MPSLGGATEWLNSAPLGPAGEWTIGRESVVLDQAGGSIAYRFRARDVHLVLSRGAGGPIPFRVVLDGQAPGPSHGRLYQLVRAHDAVRSRTLEITFWEPGTVLD
jgi:hypothetical protein